MTLIVYDPAARKFVDEGIKTLEGKYDRSH
jgi:hypothetical protein